MPIDRVSGLRLQWELTNSSADNGKRHREAWKATLRKNIPGLLVILWLRRLNNDEIDKRTDGEPINEIPQIFYFHKYSIKPFFPRPFRNRRRERRSALRHIKFFAFNQFRVVVKNIGVKCFLPYRRRRGQSWQQINCWHRFKKHQNCRGSSLDTPFICYVYQCLHVRQLHVNKGKK